MTAPASRRGFLRDLAKLPLIGGGVTIIGAPTAVAEPITEDLLCNYETWLSQELYALARERRSGLPVGHYASVPTSAWRWHNQQRGTEAPSTRAALVLSTVGCGWEWLL